MGLKLMLILGLLGMYFHAAVVFVTSRTLLLKLAVAILWSGPYAPYQTGYRSFMLMHAVQCSV